MSTRLVIVLATLALFAGAAPALAAPSYVAVFAQPVTAAKIVSSERLWTCAGTTCVAAGKTDTPSRHICSRLARALGTLTSFAVREQAFDAAELEACNAKATGKSSAS